MLSSLLDMLFDSCTYRSILKTSVYKVFIKSSVKFPGHLLVLVERDKTKWMKIDAAIKKEIGKHFMFPAVRRCWFPFQTGLIIPQCLNCHQMVCWPYCHCPWLTKLTWTRSQETRKQCHKPSAFMAHCTDAGICGKMSQTMTERINEHVFKTEPK